VGVFLNGSTARRIAVDPPIRVVVFHATAVARPDGTVNFYEDVYGHDRRLEQSLRRTAGPP
jgi:murein L,D-transpeptidase YcbB/YkuD